MGGLEMESRVPGRRRRPRPRPLPLAAAAAAAKKKKKAAEGWPLLAETTTQLIGRQDNTSKQKGRMVAWWGPAFAFLRFDLKLET